MLITRRDPFTGKENTLDLNVTQDQFDSWEAGELIQNAFPHLTPDEREFILTGITSDSWDIYLNENYEEDTILINKQDLS